MLTLGNLQGFWAGGSVEPVVATYLWTRTGASALSGSGVAFGSTGRVAFCLNSQASGSYGTITIGGVTATVLENFFVGGGNRAFCICYADVASSSGDFSVSGVPGGFTSAFSLTKGLTTQHAGGGGGAGFSTVFNVPAGSAILGVGSSGVFPSAGGSWSAGMVADYSLIAVISSLHGHQNVEAANPSLTTGVYFNGGVGGGAFAVFSP